MSFMSPFVMCLLGKLDKYGSSRNIFAKASTLLIEEYRKAIGYCA